MDKLAAAQYRKTLAELLAEIEGATTPELRAPVVARMHNVLFPLHVVDTHAAQHIQEALIKLKHPDEALVNAARQTISEALLRFEATINAHPEEPFVIFGESERLFMKPVALAELNSLRERSRLIGEQHEPYILAIDSTPAIERVFRNADAETLIPALQRLGFPNTEALVFFRTRAQPKLGKPSLGMPSVKICTLRGGVPVTFVRERIFS